MENYGVARQTVHNAIASLRTAGLVETRPGFGWFVVDRPPVTRLARTRLSREERAAGRGAFLTDAQAGGWTPSVEVTVQVRQTPDPDVAEVLATDLVTVRDRIMSAGQMVTQLATSYLPTEITAGTAMEREDSGPGGIYARLEEAGYTLTSYTEVVIAREPTDREAELLGVQAGRPVLQITRHALAGDRIVEVNHITVAGDRYQLVYSWPAE
jgi:GntR family transcriptional regulator